jgi:phage baseplate assembly protein V
MSNARIGDLERRMTNMIRPGTIVDADYSDANKPRVKVALGKNKTAWLPWLTERAGENRTWHPPEIGEQVIVISPSGELAAGYVLPGSVNKTDYPANGDTSDITRTTYKDGAVIEYDRENHEHLMTIPTGGKATVKVGDDSQTEITDSKITHSVGDDAETEITASKITHKLGAGAKIEVTSSAVTITVGGSVLTISGANISLSSGTITVTGPVTQTGGNLTSDGIGLQTHKHTGVTTGYSTTATPIA